MIVTIEAFARGAGISQRTIETLTGVAVGLLEERCYEMVGCEMAVTPCEAGEERNPPLAPPLKGGGTGGTGGGCGVLVIEISVSGRIPPRALADLNRDLWGRVSGLDLPEGTHDRVVVIYAPV